jgi:hypothetical protein
MDRFCLFVTGFLLGGLALLGGLFLWVWLDERSGGSSRSSYASGYSSRSGSGYAHRYSSPDDGGYDTYAGGGGNYGPGGMYASRSVYTRGGGNYGPDGVYGSRGFARGGGNYGPGGVNGSRSSARGGANYIPGGPGW